MKPPRAEIVTRGRIYNHPAIIRCGECGVLERLTDPDATAEFEATGRGWHYTLENGWVCCDCFPLSRLRNGEKNRPIKHLAATMQQEGA